MNFAAPPVPTPQPPRPKIAYLALGAVVNIVTISTIGSPVHDTFTALLATAAGALGSTQGSNVITFTNPINWS